MIDYQLLRKYIFYIFGKLTNDQHIKMFEYDIQIKQIYDDMKKLVLEEKGDKMKDENEMEHEKNREEELFHFIHPEVEDDEAWRIHHAIVRLVTHQKIPEICQYLYQMAKDKKILLPQMPSVAYAEMVRMGMPTTAGFSEKNFKNNYKSI